MRSLRYWIIILQCVRIFAEAPDITLLTYENGSKNTTYCIAGSNVESGVFIAGNLSEHVEEADKNYLKEIILPAHKLLEKRKSNSRFFSPVLDKRWQSIEFETTITNHGASKKLSMKDYLVLSVRSDGNIALKLSDRHKIEIKNSGTVIINELVGELKHWNRIGTEIIQKFSNREWLHIGINNKTSTLTSSPNSKDIALKFKIDTNIVISSNKLAHWKIHDFDYWEIMEKVTSSDGIVFPKLVDLRNETDCVAAYVLSCKGCEMNAGIGKNSEVAKYDSVETSDGKTWQKMKINTRGLKPDLYDLYLGNDFKSGQQPFWAISHLHYCAKNEFWTIKVDHNNAKEYYCATVAGEKAQFMKNSKFVGNKCNYGFIGTDCQINCSAIATNVDICKNSIICAPNDHIPAGSDCFCPTTSRLCKPENRSKLQHLQSPTTTSNTTTTTQTTPIQSFVNSVNHSQENTTTPATVLLKIPVRVDWKVSLLLWPTVGVVLVIFLLFITFFVVYCSVKRRSPNQAVYDCEEVEMLAADIVEKFQSEVKGYMKSSAKIMLRRSNDYTFDHNNGYEQPNCACQRLNDMDYIYVVKCCDLLDLFKIAWNQKVGTIIAVKSNAMDDHSMELPNNLGTTKIKDFCVDFGKLEKNSHFVTKHLVICKNLESRDLTIYETFWLQDDYPLDFIHLQLHLMYHRRDARPILIYCSDNNKSCISILCHAALRAYKVEGKIDASKIVKLISLVYSLFDNGLVLNNVARRLLLILLECLAMKNMATEITDQIRLNIRIKLKAGLLKEEMDYLNMVRWRDEEMWKLTTINRTVAKYIQSCPEEVTVHDTNVAINKYEIHIGDRKFVMVSKPKPKLYHKYFKYIANNDVSILISFDYTLIYQKNEDVKISQIKHIKKAFYEIFDYVIEFSPKFFKTTQEKYTKNVKLINMKLSHDNVKKFAEFCDIVGGYLTDNIKMVHITCKDGIFDSGFLVAFFMIKEQIYFDKNVDIPSIVRQFRRLNSNFFKNLTDFRMLYYFVVELANNNEYSYIC